MHNWNGRREDKKQRSHGRRDDRGTEICRAREKWDILAQTHTSAQELSFTDDTWCFFLASTRARGRTRWSVYGMFTPLTARVRVKDRRMPSCWWGRIQADYRGEIRSLRPADPVFYLWKTGGCMSQQDGKVCLDGQWVQRWEGPRSKEALLSEYARSAFKWCEWEVGRVKQDGKIPLIRALVHKRGQALATLTPAGQLGTLGGFCLDDGGEKVWLKVTWYQSHHKECIFN